MMEFIRIQPPDDYTPQERAALITFRLLAGDELTTMQIAERVGVSWHGASAMMERISRVVPVYREGCHWRKLE
jgi:hypothetical protein